MTIQNFSTKTKDWYKSFVDEVSKQGGSITLPFEAEGMVSEKDPFAGMDKRALKQKNGRNFSYTLRK